MTEKQRQKDDLAIRRVRAARHEISAEHDHDPKRVVDYYVERQKNQAAEEADSADET
jgi:hypothetical protein